MSIAFGNVNGVDFVPSKTTAAAASLTAPLPPVSVGDFIVVAAYSEAAAATIAVPAGYSEAPGGGTGGATHVFFKVADGTETEVVLALTENTSYIQAIAKKITGQAQAITVAAFAGQPGGSNWNSPSVTTTVDGSLVFFGGGASGISDWLADDEPDTSTLVFQESTDSTWFGLAFESIQAAGETGTRLWTNAQHAKLAFAYVIAPVANGITDIDGDEQVEDGQTNVPVSGANLTTTGDVVLRSGAIEIIQAVSNRTATGFNWDAVALGNLPYSDANHAHVLVVDDGLGGEYTRGLIVDPPAGRDALPVLASALLTSADSIGSALDGPAQDSDQFDVPLGYDDNGTQEAIDWETDGSGNLSGRIATMSGSGNAVLTIRYWDSVAKTWSAFTATTVAGVVDNTAPQFTAGPAAANIQQTSVDITFTADEAGNYRIVVVPSADPAPSDSEVLAGTAGGGGSALFASSLLSYDADVQVATPTTGLQAGDSVMAYVALQDAAGNVQVADTGVINLLEATDNEAPTITLAVSSAESLHTFTPTVSDNVGVITVEYTVNGGAQAELTSAPWQWAWDASEAAAGLYSVTATASDAAGNSTISNTIQIEVLPSEVTPTPSRIGRRPGTYEQRDNTWYLIER